MCGQCFHSFTHLFRHAHNCLLGVVDIETAIVVFIKSVRQTSKQIMAGWYKYSVGDFKCFI